ncbi:hypothetical protein E8D34_05245 [Nocardioides sp. GY 10113]|uniref:hypothetical protein n=1 Tax=Nocardioides sp. GY 10113 TaxID=2569761 RepID=UPI0010A89FD3|nr:hypothetical protein [Nocardioides sp. GY 10113]TIC88341.1 hypothetical protein E8D34_05245 [Nocardioides sp. GY 10113]
MSRAPASPPAAPSDAQLRALLRRAASCDPTAASRFYDATAADAWRLALAVTGSERAATEAMVDAYTSVWAGAPNYLAGGAGPRPRPRTWLLAQVRSSARSTTGTIDQMMNEEDDRG